MSIEIRNVSKQFGSFQALRDVSLDIKSGELIALLGPSGCGKTTLLRIIAGLETPDVGSIHFSGQAIHGLRDHQIARKGVVRTFQNVRLFRDMTAVENLLVAQHKHLNTGLLSGLFKTPAFRRSEKEALDFAAQWLERVGLTEIANRPAGTLAYGQQRRLEIARCMMTRPSLLMLDEPAAGLNPRETEELEALLAGLRQEHQITVLLIEHDMRLVMSISDHIYVINQGRPLADGTPQQVREHPEVIKAYLGEA